eukprot:scaffold332_cov105-Isochrysis_galbana.AAC.13
MLRLRLDCGRWGRYGAGYPCETPFQELATKPRYVDGHIAGWPCIVAESGGDGNGRAALAPKATGHTGAPDGQE